MREFDADAGKMVGYLFSCVSTALRHHADVQARVEAGELRLPRMADFTEWVEAAAPAIGILVGAFAKMLNSEQSVVQADAVQGDPITDGLVRYFSGPNAAPLAVTARDLLDLLRADDPTRDWPDVKAVKGRLRRLAQGLRDSGIKIEFAKDGHAKRAVFEISVTEAFEPISVKPRPAPRDPF